jgi:pimeloyl-ACP methyl ester carboxylesterase
VVGAPNIIVANYTQKLDHFNASETRSWQQMYQMNNNVYKQGGPIFVMISGEAPADITWMTFGQWYKNAKIFGALMFQLEHRFFGQSHPLEDASDASFQYLSSDQALADLDDFIKAMMAQYKTDQVVVFGGSYAGNLAAWYRSKYSTALGSIASSGPVTAELDFTQYLETVGSTMDYFKAGCQDLVNQAFTSIQSLIDKKDTATLHTLFNPCVRPLNYSDPWDISSFYDTLINPWAGAVQYTAPDDASSEVYEMCSYMADSTKGSDPVHRLSTIYQEIFDGSCTEHDYSEYITLLRQTQWTDDAVKRGIRQWEWLTCSEFAYYQSTDGKNQPFGQTLPVQFMINVTCTEVFGITYSDIATNVDNTNINYGAVNGKETNVYLPNGSLDPWHNLAIYETAPDTSDTIGFMNGTSHCYDMMDDLDSDPPQLTVVRYQITQQIAEWLAPPTPAPSGCYKIKFSVVFLLVALLACLIQ